jgi:hypothetical protein
MQAKPTAFLSHSSSDRLIADKLAADLRALGICVWIDSERIKYGQSIPRAIEEGLKLSTAVLVLISDAFSRSRWCRAEYEPILSTEIDSGRLLVVPVLVETAEIPLLLRSKRYCDLRFDIKDSGSYDRRKRNLSELASQIAAQHQTEQLVPTLDEKVSGRTPTEILLWAIDELCITGFVADVRKSLNSQTAIDLLEEIIGLIEQFEIQYDELITVLNEASYQWTIHGSANRVSRSRLLQVNRKLITVSIAHHVSRRFSLPPSSKEIIESITTTCLQVGVLEDFLVIEAVENSNGVPFEVAEQRKPLGSQFSRNIVESGAWGDVGRRCSTCRTLPRGAHQIERL